MSGEWKKKMANKKQQKQFHALNIQKIWMVRKQKKIAN